MLHPFAITKYYEDEEKRKQKGYRLYTALQLADGSHVVVSAEVKNAGRDIEVNAINTIFGRNSLSDVHDELIYTSETITPEQSSLLERNNLAQYPTEQELSADKDTNSSEETNGSGKESTDSNSEVIADKQADEESGVQSEAPAGQEGQAAEQAETPAEQGEQSTGQAEQPAPLTDAQKQVASGPQNQELQEQKRQEPLKARAKEWEARTGVKVNAISSIDEVSNKQARKAIESGETVFGWFEPKTGTVCIYLPHVPNESEIDKTYIHEVVSHKGLRELLDERNFERIKRQAEREGEHILVLPSSVEEEAGALPGRPSDLSSEVKDKDREKSTESNTSTSEETSQPTEAQKDVLGRVFGMSPEEVEKEHKARKSRKKDNEQGKKIEDFGETIAGARTGRGVYLRSKYGKPERPASPF